MELFILSYFLWWKKISFLFASWVSDQIRQRLLLMSAVNKQNEASVKSYNC